MVDHFIPGTMDPMVAEAVNAANPVMYAFMFDPDRVGACRATVVGDDGVYMYARAAGFDFLELEWDFRFGRGGHVERFARNLNRPKLPLAAFATVFDFYRTAARVMHDTEAQMTFWWANTPELKASVPRDETIVWWTDDVFSYVPRQRNTHASSSVGNDAVYRDLVARYPILAETHSHDSMGAFMSGTDRANSDVPCFQMVFGRVDTARPQFNAWLAVDNRHVFEDMDVDEAFGFIEKVPLLGPLAPAPVMRSAGPVVSGACGAPADGDPAIEAVVPGAPHEDMSLYESLLVDVAALTHAKDYYGADMPDATVDAAVADVIRDNVVDYVPDDASIDRSSPTWYPDLITDILYGVETDLDAELDPAIRLDEADDGWGGYAYAGGTAHVSDTSYARRPTSYAVREDVTGVIDADELLRHSRFSEFAKVWLARISNGVECRVAGVVRGVDPVPGVAPAASGAVTALPSSHVRHVVGCEPCKAVGMMGPRREAPPTGRETITEYR